MKKSTTPRVAFETLGCKLNQYETDAIATELLRRGYTLIDREGSQDSADVVVVNTCTVTNKADRKSRNTANRAVRWAGSAGIVVLTGCYVDSAREHLVDSGATYVVDNAHKNTIPELLDAHFRGELVDPDALDPNVFGFSPPEPLFHTRTTIKVQDGCDNFCTFCIIPFVRGRARSRAPEEVLAEARQAIRSGARELVLTGVNMSRYTAKDDESGIRTFSDLVAAILNLPGEFRLRISSLEPDQLDERFVDLFRHPKMTPHLHLCLQSGSDRTLLAMRRMYTVQQYRAVVAGLREIDPDFTITTDLIVGFPGEEERDFIASRELVEAVDVSHVHMFPFSVRGGTRAERMPHQVPNDTKSERARIIQEDSIQRKRRIRQRFVGRQVTMVVESLNATSTGVRARGMSEYYHPVEVRLPKLHGVAKNQFLLVQISGVEDGADPALVGVPVASAQQ